MKIEAQSMGSAAASGFGADLLTALQCMFFLLIGFAVTRTWMWYRGARTMKIVLAKKVDEANESIKKPDIVCEEETLMKSKSSESRQANAKQRKQAKKGKDQESKVSVAEPSVEPALLPSPPVQATVEPPADVHSKPISPTGDVQASERLSKMMAKKTERKAKKAQAPGPVMTEEEAEVEVVELPAWPVATELAVKVTVATEEVAEVEVVAVPLLGDKGAGPDVEKHPEASEESTSSEVDSMEASKQTNETSEESESGEQSVDAASEKATKQLELAIDCPNVPLNVNFDDIESDTDSDSDMCEQSPSALELQNAPILWCGGPATPTDGWVAVAVPVEYAPAGAFDGLWTNKAAEKILIEKLQIMFESGATWEMNMLSVTSLSVSLGGEEFSAEIDESRQLLSWTDGDVWTFHGSAEVKEKSQEFTTQELLGEQAQQQLVPQEFLVEQQPQQQWIQPEFYGEQTQQQWAPQEMTQEMPCMMWDATSYGNYMPTEEVPIVPMAIANQMIPQNAEQWEVCWDWQKKGWCKKGSACDWYHPPPQGETFCGTCEEMPFAC